MKNTEINILFIIYLSRLGHSLHHAFIITKCPISFMSNPVKQGFQALKKEEKLKWQSLVVKA